MSELRSLLAKFDVEVKGSEKLGRIGKLFTSGSSKAKAFAVAVKTLIAAFAALGLKKAISKVTDWITGVTSAVDSIGKLSTTLGISTNAIQKWNHLAGESGGSAEDVAKSMKRLTKAMFDAQRSNGPAREAFKQLNVEYEDADGNLRNLEETMVAASAAIGGTNNNTQKLALSQELLGRGVFKLIPGFKATEEEMRKQLDTMGELHGLIDEKFIRAAEATNDEFSRLEDQFMVVRTVIVGAFLPAFRWVVNSLAKATDGVQRFLKRTGALDRWLRLGTLGALGAVLWRLVTNWRVLASMAKRALIFLRPYALAIAKFALFALILDDIVVFLQGGNSLLGKWIDKIFGIGTSARAVQTLHDILAVLIGLFWKGIEVAKQIGADFVYAFGKGGAAAERLGADIAFAFNDAVDWVLSLVARLAELIESFLAITGTTEVVRAAFEVFGAGVNAVFETAIGWVQELISWLDKATPLIDAVRTGAGFVSELAGDVGEGLEFAVTAVPEGVFQLEDARQNARAIAKTTQNNVTNVTDNSTTSLTLQGRQTPETVKAATKEVKKMKPSNKGLANSGFRGK